ncbi:uncharacterized protein LOC123541559 [Mercenaria mercenaria]|uniref:uncharacterized protein LOC123541559 n=1 Tax=Mercenaria mercenaria TaxID=6596 RepID=UPI00234F5D95|nr:uncharacterized protein LOC123541559 [Mercenaria mercenaria]
MVLQYFVFPFPGAISTNLYPKKRHISTPGCLYGLIFMSFAFLVVVLLIRTLSDCGYGSFHTKLNTGKQCAREKDSSVLDTNANVTEMGKHKLNVKERMQHVREICSRPSTKVNLLFKERDAICYCDIPKGASTFIHKILEHYFFNQGHGHVTSKLVTNECKVFTNKSSHSHTYSFMFVKEPYSRLFSVYETYFFLPSDYWDLIGSDVIHKVRQNATSTSKALGHDVTFAELVKYVVVLHDLHNLTYRNLAPIYTLCNPCDTTYDFIGKVETLSENFEMLVSEWIKKGLVHNDTVPVKEVELEVNYRLSLGWIQKLYKMYNKYKSSISHFKLLQRFWSSSQIKGKISKYYEIPYFKDDSEEIDKATFTRSFQSAMYASKSNIDELKAQRQEALEQAYGTVPFELMIKLKKVLKHDFLIFDYDDQPVYLFDRPVNSDVNQKFHDYFQGL